MKTKTYIITIIAALFFVFGCKKEIEKKPNINETKEAQRTEFLHLVLENNPDSVLSIYSELVIAFDKPVETPFNSEKGFKMWYFIREKKVYYMDSTEVSGSWMLNATKDTLLFIPNGILLNNSRLRVNVMVGLTYYESSNPSEGIKDFPLNNELYVKESEFLTFHTDENVPMTPSAPSFEYTFSYKLNEVYKINNRIVKFEVSSLELTDMINKNKIDVIISKDAYKLKVSTNENFKSFSQVQLGLKIRLIEYKNKVWQTYKNQDTAYYFSYTFSYHIPVVKLDSSSIVYSYPWDRQYYFLKNESSYGFVKLKAPFMHVFEPGIVFTARYNLLHGDSIDVALEYNKDSNYFFFLIPQELQNSKIYRLRFFYKNGSVSNPFYDIYFRTSRYNRFEDKWKDVNLGYPTIMDKSEYYLMYLGSKCNTAYENFDFFEKQNIILMEIDTFGYYSPGDFYGLYNMGKYGYKITWRKEKPFGIPPKYAVSIGNENEFNYYKLSDEMIEKGFADELPGTYLYYKQILVYNLDLKDVREQILQASHVLNQWEKKIIYAEYCLHAESKYLIRLKYILPGGKTTYSTNVVLDKREQMKNLIK